MTDLTIASSLTHGSLRLLGACLLLAAGAGSVLAQNRAAQVLVVTGSVVAIDTQGRQRALEKGGDVRQGDRIVTGDGALAQIRMNDGGFMSIRSATEMAIDRFVYDDKESGKSNFLVSLVKGGFRSITGLIGKTNPGAYQIRTTTATIGIRGTDHEPMVILPGNPALGAAGLYDKVNEGETFIRSDLGQLALVRGQVGFTPAVPTQAPQVLQRVPDFYKIEIKIDARDPKDAVTTSRVAPEAEKPAADGAVLLRPSTAARREALKEADAAVPATSGGVVGATSVLKAGTAVLIAPVTTLAVPAATLISPATTLVSPTTTLISPTSTLIAPTTTLISPTTTLISPATTLVSPTTTLISPATTLISPTTTLIAPTTTYIAPATTLISPTTTYIAPTTTLVAPTTTLTAPTTTLVAPATKLTAPTTILTAPKTLNSTVLIK